MLHLIPENSIGQLGAHRRDPVLGQEAFLGIIGPDHHVNVRVMPFVMEGGIPVKVLERYLHRLRQRRCVLHEECAPRIGVVVFQTGGILTAQRVDDGPHISLMRFQL